MRNDAGEIGLFNSPTSGMVLNNDVWYSAEWDSKFWTPLLPGESVTLVQE
jgi:hypothetical protein